MTIYAQQPTAIKKLTGILLDETQQPLPGVAISALTTDSVCLTTAISDSLGKFQMQYTRQDVRLVASILGYEKRYLTVKKDNDKPVTVVLKPTANMIGEVIVSGRNMVRKDNRLLIYPTENVKKNSYDGYSTLNLIDVAGLDVDIFDQTVTTMGKATMLCINGREVKADEINTLNPQDIKRIDYYQTFDPKHPDAKAVIDFIMKNRDHGGMLYAKVDHNANIAKGNGLVDVKQYSGKSEYEVQLSGNYARYTPKEGTQSTTYMPFATGDVWKNTTYLPSSERNNGTALKLAYLYKGGDKERQSKFNVSALLQKKHNISGKNMVETFNDDVATASDRRHRDDISPSIKLYYEARTKKYNFTYSIDGSYNNVDNDRDYVSITPITSTTNQKYYYVLNDLNYSRAIGKRHEGYMMFKHYYNGFKTTYNESQENNTNRFNNNQVALVIGDNYEAIKDKLFLTFALAECLQFFDNGTEKRTINYFFPYINYSAILSDKNSLMGFIGKNIYAPDFSYYNETEQGIDKYQRLRGNPNLDTDDRYMISSTFSHNDKWGGFNIYGGYLYMKNRIYKVVNLDDTRNIYIHSYINSDWKSDAYASATLTLNLIKNKLKWKGSANYNYYGDAVQSNNSCSDISFSTSITYIAKNMTAKMDISTPQRYISMGEWSKTPINLRLSMTYTYDNWHFTLGMKNPFYKVYKEQEYHYGGYMTSSRQYSPYSNYNVFTIGANYRINYGKKHKFQNVEMDETLKSAILE